MFYFKLRLFIQNIGIICNKWPLDGSEKPFVEM